MPRLPRLDAPALTSASFNAATIGIFFSSVAFRQTAYIAPGNRLELSRYGAHHPNQCERVERPRGIVR